MKFLKWWLTVFCVMMAAVQFTQVRGATTEKSVVKVFSQIRFPNPLRPWINGNPVQLSGSGVVLDRKRILTNAHLVLYADEIFVQGGQGGDRIEAKVVSMGPAIDLAILSLEDEAFFADHPPITFTTKLPEISSKVQVLGYPIGGTTLSTTEGTVSRIEYIAYLTGGEGLSIQVDAAVNPGNSGGPAMVNGQMIGLIYGSTENIGVIIPIQEINEFQNDVADGRYDGKPLMIDQFQPLENEALRGKLGVAKNVRGMMVRRPDRREQTGVLKEFDILTKIGPHDIDNEGMIQLDNNTRIMFESSVPKLARDGPIPLSVIREGKQVNLAFQVRRESGRLIRGYDGKRPSYFVCGPLVFSPVVAEAISIYMRANPRAAYQNSPMVTRFNDQRRFEGEELVVVTSPLLRSRLAKGYRDPLGRS